MSTRAKILAGLTGAAAVAAVTLAPTAQSQYLSHITSTITWTGAPCIRVTSPHLANRYLVSPGVICGGVSRVSYWASPGMYVGADPIMDGASSVSCSLMINGWMDNADSAIAHDGHDANCLRVLVGAPMRVPLQRAF
jgi:hypothetical protein